MFTLIKESKIYASIPEQGSISDAIAISRNGAVKDIKVNTKLSLTNDATISLSIKAPSGKTVLLKENAENTTLPTVFGGEVLADLIGEEAKGNWSITASDTTGGDSGTLDWWGIELDCEAYQNSISEIFIPEAESEKILTSTQECRFSGRVIDTHIDVEIAHPLIGDLIVSIISPSGKEVVLHDRAGGSQNHLKQQWSGNSLDGLKGEKTSGTWTLKIKNLHSSGEGVLKHWKIKFHYEPEDDLKVVEGIGPKIEELLKNAGIYSYVSLATTSPESIKDILTAAGDRFNMHDPGTWPSQASLAAQGRWDELNALKEVLDGGR